MLAWGWTGPRRQAKQRAAQTRLKERKPSLPLFPFGDRGLWFQDAKSGVLSIRDTRAHWTSCSSLNLNLFQQVLPGIKPFSPSWFLFFKRIITHMHTRVCACCSTGVAVRGQWELVLSFHHAGSGESSSIPQTWHQVPFPLSLAWMAPFNRLINFKTEESNLCAQSDILTCADTAGCLTDAQQQAFG